MLRNGGARGQSRSSALWGTGNNGDSRSNALWGKGGRGFVTIVAAVLVLGIPLGASAGGNGSNSKSRQGASMAYMTSALASAARANPGQSFQVIVQTRGAKGGDLAAKEIDAARNDHPGHAYGVGRRFQVINGASAQLTGAQILDLATKNDVVAITVDATMAASGHRKQSGSASTTSTTTTTCDACPYEGIYWPYVTGVTGFWPKRGEKSAPPPQAPTIAIVDSGIDSTNTIFGAASPSR